MTAAAARRTALAAQGFTDPRPAGPPTRRHLQRVLDRVQLLQLDSVNVAVRAHYAPVFARLGGYPVELLDDAAWSSTARRPRLLVEYWAHEASLLPVADWPLLRWRMREHQRAPGPWTAEVLRRVPGLVDEVLAAVAELGPSGAGALQAAVGDPGRVKRGSWWDRSDTKFVCEYLFASGALTCGQRVNFERRYDLPQRVLPAEVFAAPEPDAATAQRALVELAATALGVATEADLRDYYRLSPPAGRAAVAELVADGVLEPVEVPGWPAAYRHRAVRTPRRVSARALLCPFDPLIWARARTERIFDFRYRIEIYTPAAKRQHGYYVYPFLLDDALVGRVDLKADRKAGVLRVQGAFAEPSVDVCRVAAELAVELDAMAQWLHLDGVAVTERGDLAAPPTAALSAAAA
ncbi:MAG: winged helix-turn-helix domain-containing protein [Pseudonocardia sp.]